IPGQRSASSRQTASASDVEKRLVTQIISCMAGPFSSMTISTVSRRDAVSSITGMMTETLGSLVAVIKVALRVLSSGGDGCFITLAPIEAPIRRFGSQGVLLL